MKTFANQFKTITLALLALMAFSFTACEKDDVRPPLKEDLVGTWDVTSYLLVEDEYMGLIFESATLKFEPITNEEGEFTQTVTFPDEESTSITGTYGVDEEDGKVFMTYDGDIVIARVKIEGDEMEWDGTQDGFPLEIKATRR